MWSNKDQYLLPLLIITLGILVTHVQSKTASHKKAGSKSKLDDDYSRNGRQRERYPSYSDHVDRVQGSSENQQGSQQHYGYDNAAYNSRERAEDDSYGEAKDDSYRPKERGYGKSESGRSRKREGYGSPRDTVYGGPSRSYGTTSATSKKRNHGKERKSRGRTPFPKNNWSEPKDFPKNDWGPEKEFKNEEWEDSAKNYKKPGAKSWGYGYGDHYGDDHGDSYHRGYGVKPHRGGHRDKYLDFDFFDKHDGYHDHYDPPKKKRPSYHAHRPSYHPDDYDTYDHHDNSYHDGYGHGYGSYHTPEIQCYQCAYSPPDVTYKTIKIPVESYSAYSADAYGPPRVDYIVKRVAIRTDGGWDRCMGPFTHKEAKYHGINVYGCKNNCYVRVDYNGNLYRGCYKGEYKVNPHRLGCHYQADSLYCFCHGDKCNNGTPPRHEDYSH